MSLQPKHVSVQVTPMNFRGENARTTMVPIFPEGDERNLSSPAGPGKYTITFILSRPRHVVVSESVHNWSDVVKNDSHLAITQPAITPKNSPDAVAIKVRTMGADGHRWNSPVTRMKWVISVSFGRSHLMPRASTTLSRQPERRLSGLDRSRGDATASLFNYVSVEPPHRDRHQSAKSWGLRGQSPCRWSPPRALLPSDSRGVQFFD